MSVFLLTGGDCSTRHQQAAELARKYLLSGPMDVWQHQDLVTIFPETSITIADIRSVIHRINQGSLSGGTTVVILEDFHLATLEAQNAFLKTLEEPPAAGIIILTAVSADMVLPTVVSRTAEIRLPPSARGGANPQTELLTLLTSEPIQARAFLDRIAGARSDALDQMTQLLSAANDGLISQKSPAEMHRYQKILTALQTALRRIKKNANLRLTLAAALEQIET